MTRHVRNLLVLTAALVLVAACGTAPDVPPVVNEELTVEVVGEGRVTSSPAGIDTTTTDTAEFARGTAVTLTATADDGWSFDGFTVAGDAECVDDGNASTCALVMSAARSVTATFVQDVVPDTAELTVVLEGDGSGTVTSNPEGIDTAANEMTATFEGGDTVTLTAVADAGSTFTGFTVEGDATCADDGDAATCVLVMNADRTVTATFTEDVVIPDFADLTVEVEGTGTVTSDPEGIDTAANEMTATFPGGTEVTLTAVPEGDDVVTWTGADCTGVECTVVMNADLTVTATFSEAPEFEVTTVRIDSRQASAAEFLQNSINDPVRWPEGHVFWDSSDIDLGFDTQHGPNIVGLRFAGLDLPAGAVIQSASITFTAFGTPAGRGGEVALSITAQDSSSPAAFVADPNQGATFDLSDVRPRVAASIPWVISESWAAGEEYSVDVTPVLQQVAGRQDWSAGGAVVFIIDANASETQSRRAAPGDEAEDGPLLTVEYTVP